MKKELTPEEKEMKKLKARGNLTLLASNLFGQPIPSCKSTVDGFCDLAERGIDKIKNVLGGNNGTNLK